MTNSFQLQFPKEIKGVLLDMDGTIIDSGGVWQAAIDAVVVRLKGSSYTGEIVINGLSIESIVSMLRNQFSLRASLDEIRATLEHEVTNRLSEARMFEGAPELIDFLRERDVVIGLVSNSSMQMIRSVLGANQLIDKFTSITSAEEVVRGKPDPDVYRLAAAKLRIRRSSCIAIEDSWCGVSAANAAGVFCILVCRKRSGLTGHLRHWRGLVSEGLPQVEHLLKIRLDHR